MGRSRLRTHLRPSPQDTGRAESRSFCIAASRFREMATLALDIGPGDQVILLSFTSVPPHLRPISYLEQPQEQAH